MAKRAQTDHSDTRGPRGARGPTGVHGTRGPKGARGPAGPSASKADILAAVDDQFQAIRRRLETQLTRIAQIQREVDLQHKEAAEMRYELERVHGVLKQLLSAGT